MRKTASLIGAAALVVGLTAGSYTALAASMPQSMTVPFPEDLHAPEVEERLKAMGFQNVRNVTEEGEVFRADAEWNGMTVDLLIDAETGIIRDHARQDVVGMPNFVHFPLDASVREDQVAERLNHLGYTNVHDVRGEGDVYDAKAEWANEPVNLRVDVKTGVITDLGTLDKSAGFPVWADFAFPENQVTAYDVRTKLEGLGFKNVHNVQGEGQVFTATAMWNGRSIDLRVNADSGEISPR